MSRAFEIARGVWTAAQESAPEPVQRYINPRLHATKEVARLLTRPLLPVRILSGQSRGGPIRVAYIGLKFALAPLQTFVFTQPPTVEKWGQIGFWECGRAINRFPVDLLVIASDKHLIWHLPRENALVLPEHINHQIDVRGTWDDVRHRMHKNTRDTELRRVRKYGYTYEVSHEERDFDEFYDEMYIPTMESRHGKLSYPMVRSVAAQHFKHGFLLRVMRDGQWVAGTLCQPQLGILNYRIVGVRNGDATLIREGALSTDTYAAIRYGNENGYTAVDLLGTEPYVKQGMFQSKRSWGSKLVLPSHLHRRLWLRVQRATPAVRQFLKETPLVVLDEKERLHGMVFVDDLASVTAEMERDWKAQFVTPGMESLIVRPVSHFQHPPSTQAADSEIPVLVATNTGA